MGTSVVWSVHSDLELHETAERERATVSQMTEGLSPSPHFKLLLLLTQCHTSLPCRMHFE